MTIKYSARADGAVAQSQALLTCPLPPSPQLQWEGTVQRRRDSAAAIGAFSTETGWKSIIDFLLPAGSEGGIVEELVGFQMRNWQRRLSKPEHMVT